MTLNKQRYILVLLAILSFQQSATASVPQSDAKYETLSEVDSQNANSNEQIKQKKYLTNEKQKEETIKEKASFWGLSVEEWHRFEKIKEQGGRGYWSPNLDPLTTLGVEAKTQEERERYAQLLAKKEFERTTNELAFQRVYDQMFKRLYPDVLPVELDDNPNFVAPLNFAGERMVLFLDVTDSVRGGNLLQKALNIGKEMDIYLLGTGDSDELIQKWASFQHIPIEKVQSGLITLNHDRGQWAQIGKGIAPVLLQEQQSGNWRQIELGN